APPPSSTLFPYTTLFRSNVQPTGAFSPTSIMGLVDILNTTKTRSLAQDAKLKKKLASTFTTYNSRLSIILTPDKARESSYLSSRSEEHTSELQSRENLVC